MNGTCIGSCIHLYWKLVRELEGLILTYFITESLQIFFVNSKGTRFTPFFMLFLPFCEWNFNVHKLFNGMGYFQLLKLNSSRMNTFFPPLQSFCFS